MCGMGMSKTGTQGTRNVKNYCKSRRGKCVTFLVNMFWGRKTTLPSLWFLHACLRSEDSVKTPCIESETLVLVFLLLAILDGILEPKAGQGGLRSPKIMQKNSIQFQITKKCSSISESRSAIITPKSIACTTKPQGIQPITITRRWKLRWSVRLLLYFV